MNRVTTPRTSVAEPPPRHFAISDLMILVAGSALGCAWTRANWNSAGKTIVLPTSTTWRETWQTAIQLPTPLLFSLGIAALICRFIPPRPSMVQISRQPGVVALAILTFVLSINASMLFAKFVVEFFSTALPGEVLAKAPFLLPDASELFIYQVIAAGPSVMTCWFLQNLTRQWKPDRSWMDRTGRTLGVGLITIEILWLLEWFSRPW